MVATLTVCAALLLDVVLGEPRRLHPLVGFGNLVKLIEKVFYRNSVISGAFAILILLLPLVALTLLIERVPAAWAVAINALVLYLTIGWRSLNTHAIRVREQLTANDLPAARLAAAMMVSRDTADLDSEGIAAATVESVLENGNDAIFGAIFWFLLAGLPGVVLYRLSNTLDAMWGYRNARYLRFGRVAARLDDALNFVPARLTALSYALLGRTLTALRCWQQQGSSWKSPNAGPVMAAGAGSLGLELGGIAVYHGLVQQRPILGAGRRAGTEDIDAACRLIRNCVLLWVVTLFAGAWFVD